MGLTSLDLRGPRVRHTNPTGQWTTGGGGGPTRFIALLVLHFGGFPFFMFSFLWTRKGLAETLLPCPAALPTSL